MRTRWIVNGLLAAGVVALAALFWFSRTAPEPEPQPVSRVTGDAIHHMTVRYGNHLVELSRDNPQSPWRMTTPINARPDPARVDALLQFAAAVPERRYARDGIDPATTGVADPVLTVRYNDQAPIAIGNPGPTSRRHYVRTAHALLLVAVPDIADPASNGLNYVDPQLLAPDDRLTRLTLPRMTLKKADDGTWQAAPAAQAGDRVATRATVRAWQHATARSVVAADAARARIARVTLGFSDAPTRHLDVIARTPELILRDPERDIDYHLAPNHAPPMLDMQHPESLGRNRRSKSRIPLTDSR